MLNVAVTFRMQYTALSTFDDRTDAKSWHAFYCVLSRVHNSMEAREVRTKTYVAPTLRQALDAMRLELGEDALLLATRSGVHQDGTPYAEVVGFSTTRHVPSEHVAAAAGAPSFRHRINSQKSEPIPLHHYIENHSLSGNNTIAGLYDEIHRLSAKLSELSYTVAHRYNVPLPHPYRQLYSLLQQAGFSDRYAGFLIERVTEEALPTTFDECMQQLRTVFATLLPFDRPFINGLPPVIAFSGPSGSGKTTTVMKVAIHLQRAYPSHTLRIVSADTERIGAADQLRAFTALMNLPLEIIRSHDELGIISQVKPNEVTLLDLPAPTRRSQAIVDMALSCVQTANGTILLTIPATMDASITQQVLEQYATTTNCRIVLTKLDESPRAGHILPVVWESHLPLSLVTTGTRLPDDITEPTVDFFMQLLFAQQKVAPS